MLTTDHSVFQIAKDTWAISDFLMDTMYLLTGKERALLIDTGLGIGDLEKKVRQITQLPLIVAMTHGHWDHAGAAGDFDRIFMHPADEAVMRIITCESRQSLVYSSAIRKNVPVLFPVEENIRPWKHEPCIVPLFDMQELDLGGRVVTVVETPGHTKGSVVFLDHNTRYLFSGDACNFNLIMATPDNFYPNQPRRPESEDRVALYADTVETCLRSLEKLWALRGMFDWNFTGHLDEIENRPEGHQLLQDCIQCCKNILEKGRTADRREMDAQQETVGRAKITYLNRQIYDE